MYLSFVLRMLSTLFHTLRSILYVVTLDFVYVFLLTWVPILYYLQLYKYNTCVLITLSLNITLHLPWLLPFLLVFPLAPCALCARRAPLGLWSISALPPQTNSNFDQFRPCPSDSPWTPVQPTLPPLDLSWTSFHEISPSYQSLVQPMCGRQIVNLSARLDLFVYGLRHVQTPSEYVHDRSLDWIGENHRYAQSIQSMRFALVLGSRLKLELMQLEDMVQPLSLLSFGTAKLNLVNKTMGKSKTVEKLDSHKNTNINSTACTSVLHH